jgi:hypothetical protein
MTYIINGNKLWDKLEKQMKEVAIYQVSFVVKFGCINSE